MKTPEGRVKDEIKAYLKEIGAYYFMPVQTGYGRRGVDFFICFRGHFMAVETKAGKPVATIAQARVLQDVIIAGGTGLCVNSVEQLASYINLLK